MIQKYKVKVNKFNSPLSYKNFYRIIIFNKLYINKINLYLFFKKNKFIKITKIYNNKYNIMLYNNEKINIF